MALKKIAEISTMLERWRLKNTVPPGIGLTDRNFMSTAMQQAINKTTDSESNQVYRNPFTEAIPQPVNLDLGDDHLIEYGSVFLDKEFLRACGKVGRYVSEVSGRWPLGPFFWGRNSTEPGGAVKWGVGFQFGFGGLPRINLTFLNLLHLKAQGRILHHMISLWL